MDRSGGNRMKMEVESKFNVGDRVLIGIYDEVNVVDIKFTDGFKYLVENHDGEREWKREGELYKTFMQKFYKAFGK